MACSISLAFASGDPRLSTFFANSSAGGAPCGLELEPEDVRAEFDQAFRAFAAALDVVLPDPDGGAESPARLRPRASSQGSRQPRSSAVTSPRPARRG
jgi:hypothetical protein